MRLQPPCSFVELLCDEGTQEATPTWFCSHWQVHHVTRIGMSARLAGGASRSFRSLRQLNFMQMSMPWAMSQLFGSVHVSSHSTFNQTLTDQFGFVLRCQQPTVSWTLTKTQFTRTNAICCASELGADITVDPRASSFFKAMQLCEGQTGVISLWNQCVCVWCSRSAANS